MDKADIEAVKAANPILDVLRDLGIPAQNNRIRCLKPEGHAHGDRTPSVTLWPDRGQFKCWVCPDVKGDVIDLVRLARGCTFREALEFLGRNDLGTAPLPPLRARPHADAGPPQSHPGRTRPAEPDPVLFPEARHPSDAELEDELLRHRILAALLEACAPVGGKVAQYLQKRRIFKRTWDGQKLRMIEDYAGVSRKLEAAFGFADLERLGFFNAAGHLRYYRHKLIFPYLDPQGRPVYMQARAIDADAAGPKGPAPKELSMSGPIPIPYNCRLLNGEPGQIYLCEGVIDTLTLLEQGFPAVGVPGAANFKPAWAALFRNKSVHVAFDPDAPGESGAAKTIEKLQAQGIEARRLTPPTGMDLNDWFRRG
ncbi:MAG TPA: toprim domain-containing protein [Fibrobacteria bacterium]|nr:toprim domain-containing protein [Fibrobacteria bacterium]